MMLVVDLASPTIHRALAYLVALDRQGYSPTADELESYAAQPDARPATYDSLLDMGSVFHRLSTSWSVQAERAETAVEHFLRLNWAEWCDVQTLRPTTLGRAVVGALDRQSDAADSLSDIVLDADDPIALERVLIKLCAAGPALLVDPYFRVDVLAQIVHQTEVTRVLTSERVRPKERVILGSAVEKMISDRPFEVRVASRAVHDRHLIPDTGPVHFIGTSLNGLGRVATMLGTLPDTSDTIRTMYEKIWIESEVLARIGSNGADSGS